jgi:hypothetical protein
MLRREFITFLGGAVMWPIGAHAQAPVKIARIGFLGLAPASGRIEDHDRICTVAGDTFDRRPIVCFAGTKFARHLAHDRNDLLHNIPADAAGGTSQQILYRGADLRPGVVRARKLPIVVIDIASDA